MLGETEGSLLDKRTNVINNLVQLGMLASANDWFSMQPSSVDLVELNNLVVEAGSLEAWLETTAEDMSDKELSSDLARAFTLSNGGVLSVSLGENNAVSQYVGDEASGVFQTYVTEGVEIEYQISPDDTAAVISEEGEFKFTIPSGTIPNEEITFDVFVGNKANGLGKTIQISVIPLEKQLEETKSLQPTTGEQIITNADSSTLVKAETSQLYEPINITITDGVNELGSPRSSITIEKGYKGYIEIERPEYGAAWISNTAANNFDAGLISARPSSASADTDEALNADDDYPIKHNWVHRTADVYEHRADLAIGIGNRVPGNKHRLYIDTTDQSQTMLFDEAEVALLSSDCLPTNPSCYLDKTPVLFVHGFNPSSPIWPIKGGVGGGFGTWGDLPQTLKSIDSDISLFEFQWLTAARFEDAAADLGQAIRLIAESTNHKVHIVAHSFGGVLTRTYLQNLATKFSYGDDVASVTTVGSPHSGIFDTARTAPLGLSFPQGQDSQHTAELGISSGLGSLGALSGNVQINNCAQISCYQMGEYVRFSEEDLAILQLGFEGSNQLDRADRAGYFINNLANFNEYKLPENLPIQVLIGLSTSRNINKIIDEGDGLISFEGQRISPLLLREPYLKNHTSMGGIVTETVMGFSDGFMPGGIYEEGIIGWKEGFYGFRHTAAPGSSPKDAIPEVKVDNDCITSGYITGCADRYAHPVVPLITDHIESVGNQVYTGSSVIINKTADTDIIFREGETEKQTFALSSLDQLSSQQRVFIEKVKQIVLDNDLYRSGRIHWALHDSETVDALRAESNGLLATMSTH